MRCPVTDDITDDEIRSRAVAMINGMEDGKRQKRLDGFFQAALISVAAKDYQLDHLPVMAKKLALESMVELDKNDSDISLREDEDCPFWKAESKSSKGEIFLAGVQVSFPEALPFVPSRLVDTILCATEEAGLSVEKRGL